MKRQMRPIEPLEPRSLLAVDLAVTSSNIVDGAVYSDDTTAGAFVLNIGVRNLGITTAFGAIEVDIILSKDRHIDDAVDAITRMSEWSNLEGGTLDSALQASDVEPGLTAGYYYVGLQVDATDKIIESDETNNVWWSRKPRIEIVNDVWPGDSIGGTAAADVILLEENFFQMFATINGEKRAIDPHDEFDVHNKGLFIDAGPGNDRVAALNHFETRLQVTGNTGNDTISSSGGNDELSGSFGYDRIYAGDGNDLLLGGAVNDYLNGEGGDDVMIGGGGNDRLVDFAGLDHFIAGAGNDVLLTRDAQQTPGNNPDTLSGGPGADAAQVDVSPVADDLVSIESLIA